MLAYSCFIVMWLFSSILVPGELFLIHFQKYVQQEVLSQTPNSASVSGENGKSLALRISKAKHAVCNKFLVCSDSRVRELVERGENDMAKILGYIRAWITEEW